MSKTLILRAAVTLTVVASTACSSRARVTAEEGGAGVRDASMGGEEDAPTAGDGRAGDDATPSSDAGDGDRTTDATQAPQLDLPGIVVWLDADVGIAAAGSGLVTWTDRSPYQHVFLAQAAEGDMPALTKLNGHGAVQFSGRNRVISEYAPSAAQQDALSLGRDFVVAMVFLPAREVRQRAVLTMAMLPWIASPPQPNVTTPPMHPTFTIMTQTDSTTSFQAGAGSLDVGGGFALSPQRLVMSTEAGGHIRVRLNGQLQTGTPSIDADPSDGSYAPVYLGAWDFDSRGFEGAVAEMVIVRGLADAATEQALDDYLKLKFSL